MVYTTLQLFGGGPLSLDVFSSYLWFMQDIFVFYFIALATRRLPSWVLVITPLGGVILFTDSDLHRFFYLMPFFFLGAYISAHIKLFAAVLNVRTAIFLSVIPLSLAVYSGYDGFVAASEGRGVTAGGV